MFAVLPKKPVKQDRFIVRVDKSRMKSKSDETTAKPKEEVESKEILNTTTATSTNNTPSKYFLTNNGMIQPAANTFSTENDKQEEPKKEIKKLKIRLSIIRDAPFNTFPEKKLKKSKETKIKQKKPTREGNINCGRWTLEEHQRFIEAIMKYGNEWKMVQKHVGTRSSTQARSHAQKFFVKIKKTNVIDTNIDLSKNSIKTLHELASSMNLDEYSNAVKALNCVAFEKKALNKRRKRQSSDSVSNDIINFNTSEEIFSFNTNDNTILLHSNKAESTTNPNKNVNFNSLFEEIEKTKKTKQGNTIIINNNINNYHYNLNIENFVNKKRRNSFEELFNLFPDFKEGSTMKRHFDEKDYEDNFDFAFKNVKNDFENDKDIFEEMFPHKHRRYSNIFEGLDFSMNNKQENNEDKLNSENKYLFDLFKL